MNRLQKVVVLLDLIENLRAKGSWCGETHIQKSVYFLQTIFNVPLNYEYVLYKYGPFSFDLSDELAKIRADGLLKIVPTAPFGVTFQVEEGSNQLRQKFPLTSKKFIPAIESLTNEIGTKCVKELERLTTIHYLGARNGEKVSSVELIQELVGLKPHISEPEAEEALRALADMKERWSS